MTMTYRELQIALKSFKAEGKTTIRLNSKKADLQAEYDRLTARPASTAHSFRAMAPRQKRATARGFSTGMVWSERPCEVVSMDDWRAATLAILAA